MQRKLNVVFMFASLIIFSSFSPYLASAAVEFKDVKENDEIYEHVQWLVDKGITGYEDGTYRPYETLSRQHAAIMFSKVLGLKLPDKAHVEKYFNDVEASHEYADYIAAVGEKGIFTGNEEGSFNPGNRLTREQMASTIVNAFGLKSNDKHVNINLRNVSPSHKENVQILADLKITNQLENFRPDQTVKRGQFASFLYRAYQYEKGEIAEEKPKPTPEPTPEPSTPSTKIVTEKYDYAFKTLVDKQMKVSPQTDSAGKWYHASRAMVEYYANPNNFKKDSVSYYQFLLLSGSSGVNSKELNAKILKGNGILEGKAADFKEASKIHNVNEIYLISHALLETGNGKSELAQGVEVGLDKNKKPVRVTSSNRKNLTDIKTTYNFFGIGAVDRCPLTCGSERAYAEGWFTPKAAIVGGAKFIGEKYISAGQDTLYKMRWNPANTATHQYATDVGWANKQTARIKKMFDLYENVNGFVKTFEVPAYNNQPKASGVPTGVAVFHVGNKDKGKKAVVTADSLNFRTGPTTKFPAIKGLPKGTEVTIIGENAGWYKIAVGKQEGWVLGTYLQIGGTVRAAQTFSVQSTQENPVEQPAISSETRVIGEVTEDNVYFRSEPNTKNDSMIGKLSARTKVDILDENENWTKISYKDEEGWIKSEYISITNVKEVKTNTEAKADPNGETIGELEENAAVVVVPNEKRGLTMDGKWYNIYYNGQTAWVHKDNLR